MKTVISYLEKTTQRFPNKIAVIDEQGCCSYKELYIKSKHVGDFLAEQVNPRTPIVVFMDKGIHALYSFLGIARAGCMYSLLNPDFPKHRLQQIQEILLPVAVITEKKFYAQAKDIFKKIPIFLIEDLKNYTTNITDIPSVRLHDVDPLYINFTSGSTGKPKGVVVNHRSVVDFIDCFTDLFHITHVDILANQALFDFDVSVKDIYSTIKMGATLVIIPKHLFSNPAKLLDFICEHQITTMIWAVSALSLICTFHGLDYKTPHTVNKIMFSGEVMPLKHLRTWQKHLPNAMYVNLYGPTEITCNCTYHILDSSNDYKEGIPIGKPFPNEHVFLLDQQNQEILQPHLSGEICVSGTALALVYYNAPLQSKQHFVQNPLNPHYRDIIYRTGDLASYNDKGELIYHGRKDFQIKYQGYRIELEGIEKVIHDIPGVEQCCLVYDGKRIYAFYSGQLDERPLQRFLQLKLPAYMVPAKIKKLDRLPLTANGKIDRKTLLTQGGIR